MESYYANDTARALAAQDAKLDAIYTSVEKTRKYFLWTLIISVAMVVLPLIGLIVVIPLTMHALIGGPAATLLQDSTTTTDTATLLQNVTETAKLLR